MNICNNLHNLFIRYNGITVQILLTVKYEYIPIGFSNSDLYCQFSSANQNLQ